MIDWSPAAFLLMTLAPVPSDPSPADPIQFAQVMVREQILIRVPARVRMAPNTPPPILEPGRQILLIRAEALRAEAAGQGRKQFLGRRIGHNARAAY